MFPELLATGSTLIMIDDIIANDTLDKKRQSYIVRIGDLR